MKFFGARLLRRHGRVGGGDNLEVRKAVSEEGHQLALPNRMKVQVHFVEQQQAACVERIVEVREGLGDAEQEVTNPARHALIAIAQSAEWDDTVGRLKQELLSFFVDLLESQSWQQGGDG